MPDAERSAGNKSTQGTRTRARHRSARSGASGDGVVWAYTRVDPALAARLGGLDAAEEVDRDHVLGASNLPRVAEA